MLTSQRQQLRCIACRTLFEADTPTDVPIESWLGFLRGLSCPACHAGYGQLGFGQNRTLPEDRAFPRGQGYRDRIAAWWANGEIGNAAEAIAMRLSDHPHPKTDAPADLADLRRCLLLLDRMPEWTGRMPQMAALSPTWARLATAWPDLTARFYAECGPDLDHRPAPETHALLERILTAREATRLGKAQPQQV